MRDKKLIEIKKAEKVVFVGDIHGDLVVSQKVIKEYLKPGNKIVFLGDYVDRGPKSKENLDFLLKIKNNKPDQIYLLQGNHECYRILKFVVADFWEKLNEKEFNYYSSICEKFPLAIIVSDIIALHGALPDIKNLEDINKIKIGSKEWFVITWGDFLENKGEYLGINPFYETLEIDPFTGRPQFGQDYFLKLMKRFNKKVLIRSHQPTSPLFMFNNRCLTIFTSSAYARERTIAIADFKKPIKTAKDLKILRI